MSARWGWALVAAVAAGAVAVAVVAVVDDGPQPADAQATTTTTAPGGGGGGSGTNGPLRTVTVTAEGTASGTPDTAVVQLGVQTQAASAKDALEQANQKAAQLLDALKFGGVKPDDITTTNVFVYPQYDSNGQTDHRLPGAATRSAPRSATSTNAGTIIDAAAGVVGDQITLQGVSFNIDDTGSLRQAARDDAVAHAKSQADQLAAATGLKVGKVVSIVEGTVPNIPVVYAAAGAPATTAADSAPVPLAARAAGAEPVRHGRLRADVVSGLTGRRRRCRRVRGDGQAPHRDRLRRPERARPSRTSSPCPSGCRSGAPRPRRCCRGRTRRRRRPSRRSAPAASSRRDIATANVTIWPEYGEDRRRVEGYQAQQHAVGPPAGHRRGGWRCSTRWPAWSGTTS